MKRTSVIILSAVMADLVVAPTESLSQNFWQQMNNGLNNLNVSALAADSVGTLYAATGFNLVFRSTNNGDIWTSSGQTNAANLGYLETNSFGHIFAGDFFNGVYRSTDNGSGWIQVNIDLTNTIVRALAIKPSGEIFVGTMRVGIGTILYGIYRSTNNGNSWVQVNTGLRDSTGIGSFGISPSGDIFAGSMDGGGIYRSTNNGDSWMQMNTGLPAGLNITSIAVSPNGHVFAGTTFSGGAQDTVIYRSTDNGNAWTPAYLGPPILSSVRSLAINRHGHVFAAIAQSTFGYGILRSTDDGISWSLINSGLPTNADVSDLVVNSPGYIFAGAYGAGVFRSVGSTTSVEETSGETPLSFSLGQNYPNPFNPKTKIVYRVPSRVFVELRIFDVLGQEVAILVNDVLQPGSYEVTWDGTGFASGIYFYRLRAGDFSEVKSLVLLR